MKKTVVLSLVLLAGFSKAQIGINSPTPNSTLDIVAKNSTGTSNNNDGILIPRVDRQRAQNMSGAAISTLIYINDISTGQQNGLATNIDAVGFYYFNGTAWVKMHNPTNSTFSSINLYNSDGTLTGNRSVNQNNNTLTFNGSSVNSFSVDGNTFSVDAANNRVGIGTTAPQNRLDLGASAGSSITDVAGKKLALFNNAAGSDFYGLGVNSGRLQFHASSAAGDAPKMVLTNGGSLGVGTTDPTNTLDVRSTTAGAVKIVDGTQGANKVLTSDANGVATWQSLPATPANTNIYNSDGSLTANRTITQNTSTLAFNGSSVNGFSVNGSTFSVDEANNRVGFGTSAPQARLHVDGGESRFSNGTSAWGLSPTTGGTTGSSNSLEFIDRVNHIRRMVFNDNGDVSIGGSIGSNSAKGIISIRSGNVGVNTGTPQKMLHVNANSDAVRFENLATVSNSSDILAIDATGDIRRIPYNNLNANSFGLVNISGSNYAATGNENMIWVATTSATVTLPIPTASQVGKSINIVASGNSSVTLAGVTPVVTNSVNLTTIPQGKRITVYAIPASTFGNTTNTWAVSQKDF
ncbi:hypothetical protein [Chryseobacterium sp. MMS23-Vi53]|uniref:hypothetical protein n=1 Tax=Chryseobacterium sp. MMS23-Vi53 TaxID=3386644 RepID=UPI0039E8A973